MLESTLASSVVSGTSSDQATYEIEQFQSLIQYSTAVHSITNPITHQIELQALHLLPPVAAGPVPGSGVYLGHEVWHGCMARGGEGRGVGEGKSTCTILKPMT